jgi:hypothetical protein
LDKKETAKGGLTALYADLDSSQLLIPTTIFCDRSLSFLEALVEYMKDNLKLSYHEIAVLTNRDERNIWTLYHRAIEKRKNSAPNIKKTIMTQVPLDVVTDRSVSILEVVVEYLRENAKLKNSQISKILNRSAKTVSTVYMRTKKKRSAVNNA